MWAILMIPLERIKTTWKGKCTVWQSTIFLYKWKNVCYNHTKYHKSNSWTYWFLQTVYHLLCTSKIQLWFCVTFQDCVSVDHCWLKPLYFESPIRISHSRSKTPSQISQCQKFVYSYHSFLQWYIYSDSHQIEFALHWNQF